MKTKLVITGSSEEFACLGPLLLVLPLDVLFDLFLVKPDGRDKIPNTPDAVLLKVKFADEFILFSDDQARYSFQLLDGICNRYIGRYLNLNMYVVFVSVDCVQKECRVFFAGLVEAFQKSRFDVIGKPRPAVLSAPDNVVLELVGGMV